MTTKSHSIPVLNYFFITFVISCQIVTNAQILSNARHQHLLPLTTITSTPTATLLQPGASIKVHLPPDSDQNQPQLLVWNRTTSISVRDEKWSEPNDITSFQQPQLPKLLSRPYHRPKGHTKNKGKNTIRLDSGNCHLATQLSRNSFLLKDDNANTLLWSRIRGTQNSNQNPCDDTGAIRRQKPFHLQRKRRPSSRRDRRQTLTERFEVANVQVDAMESRVSISQLINITSGVSTVNVLETFVEMRVTSTQSDVTINPDISTTNISVISPTIQVDLPQSQTQSFTIVTDKSDIFVQTNRSAADAYMMMNNGVTNATVTSQFADVFVTDADWSRANIQTWDGTFRERMVIKSDFVDKDNPSNDNRVLSILLLTQPTSATLEMASAKVTIEHDDITINIDETDHTMAIHTGVYAVTLQTTDTPYTVVIEENIEIDTLATKVVVEKATSKVTGTISDANEMTILPGREATVAIGGGQGQETTSIEVESDRLQFDVLPDDNKITAISTKSRAVITTKDMQAGIRSNQSTFDIVAGRPTVLIKAPSVVVTITPDTFVREDRGEGNTRNGRVVLPIVPETSSSANLILTEAPHKTTPMRITSTKAPPTTTTPTTSTSTTTPQRIRPSPITTARRIVDTGQPSEVLTLPPSETNNNNNNNRDRTTTTTTALFTTTATTTASPTTTTTRAPDTTTTTTTTTATPPTTTTTTATPPTTTTTTATPPTTTTTSTTLKPTTSTATKTAVLLPGRTTTTAPLVESTTTSHQHVPTSTAIIPLTKTTASNHGETFGFSTDNAQVHNNSHTKLTTHTVSETSSTSPATTTTEDNHGSPLTPQADQSKESAYGNRFSIFDTLLNGLFSSDTTTTTLPTTTRSTPMTIESTTTDMTSTISTTNILPNHTPTVANVSLSMPDISTTVAPDIVGMFVTADAPTPSTITQSVTRQAATFGFTDSTQTSTRPGSKPELEMFWNVVAIDDHRNGTNRKSTTTTTTTPHPTSTTDDFVVGQFTLSLPNRTNVQFPIPGVFPEIEKANLGFGVNGNTEFSRRRMLDDSVIDDKQHAHKLSNAEPLVSHVHPPVEPKYQLTTTIEVPKTVDTNTHEFVMNVQQSLEQAYVEARKEALGMREAAPLHLQFRRLKRQIVELENMTETEKEAELVPIEATNGVRIKITSIDRESQNRVRLRFYVIDNGHLVNGASAQSTFRHLDDKQISAILQYPIVSSIRSTQQPTPSWLPYAFALAGVCVIIVVTIVICWSCMQQKRTARLLTPRGTMTRSEGLSQINGTNTMQSTNMRQKETSSSPIILTPQSSSRASLNFDHQSRFFGSRRKLRPILDEPKMKQKWSAETLVPKRYGQQPLPTLHRLSAYNQPDFTPPTWPSSYPREHVVSVSELLDDAFPLTVTPPVRQY